MVLFCKSMVDRVAQHFTGHLCADIKINFTTIESLREPGPDLPFLVAEISGYFQVQVKLLAVQRFNFNGEFSSGNIEYCFTVAGHGFDHGALF